MSWKVLAKVYERRVGSAMKKAILSYCADKASDDGRGIWASKGTIAAELEAGRSTVIRVINELVADGLLVADGQRGCANGATVEYRIDLAVLASLPLVERPNTRPDRSQSETGPDKDQSRSETSQVDNRSQSGTPPVPERDPDQSQSGTQTSLGTSLERLDSPLPPHGEIETAVSEYNSAAEVAGLPKVQKLTSERRKKLERRLRECGGLEGWRTALSKLSASDFCCGRTDRSNWRADFDFLLQPKSFTRLIEGSYDNNEPSGGNSFHSKVKQALGGTDGLPDPYSKDHHEPQRLPGDVQDARRDGRGAASPEAPSHGGGDQQAHLQLVRPRRFG